MATNPLGSQPENQPGQQQPFQSRPTQPLYGQPQPQEAPPAPVQPYQQAQPPQYYQPPASMTRRDPQTAMIIEIVAGLLGFLGIGYLYAGRTNQGIIRLIVWWVVLGLLALSIFIAIGACLLPIAWIAGPIVSGIMLKKELETAQGIQQPANTQPFTVQDQQTFSTPPQPQTGMPQANQQICPHCGARNPAGARFCGECSTPLTTAALVPPPTESKPLIDQINYSTSVPPTGSYTPTPTQASIATPPLPTSTPPDMEPTGAVEAGTPEAAAAQSQPAAQAETGIPATTPPVEPMPLSGPAMQPEPDLVSTPPPPQPEYSTLASYEQSKTDDVVSSTGAAETLASKPAAPSPEASEPSKDDVLGAGSPSTSIPPAPNTSEPSKDDEQKPTGTA